jgi:ABC-type branched-subunit amino acid transport system substrate-binding protein
MTLKKICIYFFLAVILAAIASSCIPKLVVRTADAAVKDRNVQVSDDEVPYWQGSIKNGTDTTQRAKGAFWVGQYYFNKKDFDNAMKYFGYNEKFYTDVDWGYLSVFREADIFAGKKDMVSAMDRMKILMEKRYQFPQFKAIVTAMLEEMLRSMTPDELDRLYEKHEHKIIDENILYYQCRTAYANNDFDKFFKYAGSFLFQFRDSEYYDEILKKFKESVKYKPVNNKNVGVIIPLTGKSMDIGTVIKNGLELALSDYNTGKDAAQQVSLVYIDEAQDKLEESVIKAIEQNNVISFIGPIYSKTVKQIMPLMERYNIVLFSPTAAQPDLVSSGSYFFRDCGTAKGQAHAMAKYINENTAFKRMCTMYSDNSYGKTLNDSFVEKFSALGGTIINQASFDQDASDFRKQIVTLGGIDTMMLKARRADEAQALSEEMEKAGKMIQEKIFDYLHLYNADSDAATPTPPKNPADIKPVVTVAMLHITPRGERVKIYNMDDDMTKKLSYTMAKDPRIKVLKQSQTDSAMSEIGVGAEDLDRELALNVARQLKADILVWGKIVEADSDTIYANFVPQPYADSEGQTKFSYSFTDNDYFHFKITIDVMSTADEAVIDEIQSNYKKIKEPRFNPLNIDALYIPATDRKMVLIADQLKFYDFALPVFGSSAMSSPYISSFAESVEGVIYPAEFFADETSEPAQAFMKKYRDKYGINPDVIAANAYDAMNMICALISSNIASRESFKQVLSTVRNYEGANGAFSFDMNGDSVRDYYIMQITKGELKLLKKEKGD